MTAPSLSLASTPPTTAESIRSRLPTLVAWGLAYRRNGFDPLFAWIGGWGWMRRNLALQVSLDEADENAWLKRELTLLESVPIKRRRRDRWMSWALAVAALPAGLGVFFALAPYLYFWSFANWLRLPSVVEFAASMVVSTSCFFVIPAALSLLFSARAGWARRTELESRSSTADLVLAATPPGDAATALHLLVAEDLRRCCAFAGRFVVLLFALPVFGVLIAGDWTEIAKVAGYMLAAIWLAPTWAAGCYRRATTTAAQPNHAAASIAGLRAAFGGMAGYYARWICYNAAAMAATKWLAGIRLQNYYYYYYYYYFQNAPELTLAFAALGERWFAYRRMAAAKKMWRDRAPLLDGWLAEGVSERPSA